MDAVAFVYARCGMYAKEAGAVWKCHALLKWEARHPVEPASCTHSPLCPGKALSNLDEHRQQLKILLHLRCCGQRSISSYDVAIGIPTDKSNISECYQAFNHADRIIADGSYIAEHPICINPALRLNVVQDRI